MKGFRHWHWMFALTFACCIIGSALDAAQATPESTAFKLLEQLVGEWETESEVIGDPTQPPMKFKGTEIGRAIGDNWIVLEVKSESGVGAMSAVLTLGWDSDKKKVVGTWIDSITPYLWIYEGQVEADGKTITLNTEGPSLIAVGKKAKFREQLEFKSKDHRVFTSSVQGDDGKWTKFVTVNAKRKS